MTIIERTFIVLAIAVSSLLVGTIVFVQSGPSCEEKGGKLRTVTTYQTVIVAGKVPTQQLVTTYICVE